MKANQRPQLRRLRADHNKGGISNSYDRQKMDLLNIKDQQLEISLNLEEITDKDRSSAD